MPQWKVSRFTYTETFTNNYLEKSINTTHHLSMPNGKRTFKTREFQDVLPEHNEGLHIVPQILTKSSEDFIRTAKELKELGYDEVNLNLGCPSRTVVAKQKGSGFLREPEVLDDFLTEIFEALDMKISIKTRIGLRDTEEFEEILSIYNRHPVYELTIHPRLQQEFYKGKPHLVSLNMQ